MMIAEVSPNHLITSLLSLQSICNSKRTGTELIDDRELTGLCDRVRNELFLYNERHHIPELEIIVKRFPEPRSYSPQPTLALWTSFISRLLGLIIGALTFLFPFVFIPLALIWLTGWLIATLSFRKRAHRIEDDMRQISECCSAAVMLIRKNESYVTH